MKINFYCKTTANLARLILATSFITIIVFSGSLTYLGSGVLAITMLLASFTIGVQAAFRVIDRGVRKGSKK